MEGFRCSCAMEGSAWERVQKADPSKLLNCLSPWFLVIVQMHVYMPCLSWTLQVQYPLNLKEAQIIWRSSKGDGTKLPHENGFHSDSLQDFGSQRANFIICFLQFTNSEQVNFVTIVKSSVNGLMNCFKSQPPIVCCHFIMMQIGWCWPNELSHDWLAATSLA